MLHRIINMAILFMVQTEHRILNTVILHIVQMGHRIPDMAILFMVQMEVLVLHTEIQHIAIKKFAVRRVQFFAPTILFLNLILFSYYNIPALTAS